LTIGFIIDTKFISNKNLDEFGFKKLIIIQDELKKDE